MHCRSSYFLLILLTAVRIFAQTKTGDPTTTNTTNPGNATTKPTNAGVDETSRLMQEYMAAREEWRAIRQMALSKVAKETNENLRKTILSQAETDSQPYRVKMQVAGKAFAEAKTKKQPVAKPGNGSSP